MAHTVLPAGGRRLKVRIVRHDPGVDLLDGQGLVHRIVDGEEDQRAEAERRFVGRVDEWVVGKIGGMFWFLR